MAQNESSAGMHFHLFMAGSLVPADSVLSEQTFGHDLNLSWLPPYDAENLKAAQR